MPTCQTNRIGGTLRYAREPMEGRVGLDGSNKENHKET